MKKFLLISIVILQSIALKAQTFTANFTGAAAAIPNSATTQKCFPVTVAGVGVITPTTVGLAQVCINITHPYDEELEIILTAPDGTIVPLSIQNGGAGNNYTNTCFSATATNSIKSGTPPYAGMYLPEGHLGAVNNGQNANGTWSVCVQDRRTAANVGSLTSFTLTFSTTPAPAPPALPACSNTLPATSTCANATSICDFSGLCGSTSGSTPQTWTALNTASCFGIENNSFIKFVASATSASFSVWVPTHTIGGAYFNGGVQMLFFSGTCGGAVTTYGCYPHIYPYSAPGVPMISVVTASGLTPGNTYYLMTDGFNGDQTTFTIEALSGVGVMNITPQAPSICPGSNVSLTASGGNGTYNWTPSATLSSPTGATVTASPASTITYTVTSTTVTGCPLTKDVTVTVNAAPVFTAQPSTATQNICPGQSTTALTVTATMSTGTISGYQWYSNTVASNTGGTLIPGATSATYTPPSTPTGTLYYYCVVSGSTTCSTTSNVSGAIVISAPLTAPTATVTTQATCLTGATITVSAPLGVDYQYSIDGGVYQASPVFTNVPPGTHLIIVQNVVTGCISTATSVIVNAVTTLPPPTASVIMQATCLAGATITVSAPLGANYQYNIDGGTYQASPVFTGVAPGTHPVLVKDIVTGCISTATSVVVNAVTTLPPPTASVTTQATCLAGATITVSAPLGANYQYNIDGGTYQASPVFTGVAPGTHPVFVKDIVTGCISTATSVVVNAVTTLPPPTASVTTQATCLTGATITVSAPFGANYQYGIDGSAYQSIPVFTGIAPGTHQILVTDIVTGCISTPTSVLVNAVPALPAPTASVTTQPSCLTGGTITISAPLGANYQYNIDGGTYQASPLFTGVAPGTHAILVTDIVTGCISTATSVVANAVPTLAAPTASVTTQATCTAGATITVSAPSGANYQYNIDGGIYQAGPVFTNIAPGTHAILVKDIVTGCISTATSVTVNGSSTLPAPTASTTVQPTCIAGGTITVTAPLGADYQYSIDGVNYQAGTSFSPVNPGSYNVTVKDIVTGCISAATIVVVNAVPVLPPVQLFIVQPDCFSSSGTITVTNFPGPGYEFNINAGTYSAQFQFSNLAPGTYVIEVRDIVTGCTATSTLVQIVAATPLGAPAASVTAQPTCITGGTITVTSPLATDIQYSIDGVNYQLSNIFNNVAPGTYNVRYKNIISGCISALTTVTVNAPTGAPAAPTASVTQQPTCTIITGTITITAPVGAAFEYSINGSTYQSGTIFTGVAPGTYPVSVRNTATGCTSSPTMVTVNTLPAVPTAPIGSVTQQPTCANNTGIITITSPTGPGLQYSTDGINYQTSATITGLAPGSYNVTVKNTVSGCVSNSTVIVVNNPPNAPATPTASVTQQPTCAASGTITITAPLGTNYQYSINGTLYQPAPVFTAVAPGTYNVTVKDIVTGCISAATSVTVNAVPNVPAAPTASATQQPTCANNSGTITVTAPLGTDLEYAVNGGTYQASPVFAGLVPGSYAVKVMNSTTSCISATTTIVINAVPNTPAKPIANSTPRCGPGVVNMTASATGTINWYSDVTLTSLVNTGTTYSPSLPFSQTFYVTSTVNGCTSIATSVLALVNGLPIPNLGSDRTICKGENLTLNPGTFTSYKWQDNSTGSTFAVTASGTYAVTVKNAAGCENNTSVKITVADNCDDIYFPNTFSPNGDGKNEEFGPLPPNSFVYVTKYNLIIFNRYGQRVFQSIDPSKKWTGKFNGMLTPGNYVWYATYTFKGKAKTAKGNILVIR